MENKYTTVVSLIKEKIQFDSNLLAKTLEGKNPQKAQYKSPISSSMIKEYLTIRKNRINKRTQEFEQTYSSVFGSGLISARAIEAANEANNVASL